MCVACLTFSALTLFTPVSEAPQVADTQQNGAREIVFTRANTMPLAQETQLAIAQFLDYLPADPEIALLRDGLTQLSVALETAQSDEEAEQMVDDHLNALEDDVFASPNSERIIAVLRDIVIGDNPLQASLLNHINSRTRAFQAHV
ncbi:MAG: hypothetical protein ACFE0I_03960 [Elainellaceae cyanobacterium]